MRFTKKEPISLHLTYSVLFTFVTDNVLRGIDKERDGNRESSVSDFILTRR